jgi:hypothetical protein
MSAALKRQPVPSLSPERAALAAAIEQVRATRGIQASAAAVDWWDQKGSALRRVEAAQAALDAAKAAAIDHAAQVIRGTMPAGEPPSLSAARDECAAAQDELDATDAALKAAEAIANDADGSLAAADRSLKAAVAAVIQAEGAAHAKIVGDRLIRLQREMAGVAAEVQWLNSHGAIPRSECYGPMYGQIADEALRSALQNLTRPLLDLAPRDGRQAAWEAALAALETNATAALPPA